MSSYPANYCMSHFEMYNVSHDVHICTSGVHVLHYVKKCGHGVNRVWCKTYDFEGLGATLAHLSLEE